MGVDLGTRRIGVAISDGDGMVATPYAVLPRTDDESDAEAIRAVAGTEGVETIVVGHPLSLDGSAGPAALAAESFAAKLVERGATVTLFDERFTTTEADKRLRDRGMKGRQRRKVVDQVAATVLLQAYLDARAGGRTPAEGRDR